MTESSLAAVADSNDAIGSDNDNPIGGGEALGGENNNQQMLGVRVMMATGQLRNNDDVDVSDPVHPTHNNQP